MRWRVEALSHPEDPRFGDALRSLHRVASSSQAKLPKPSAAVKALWSRDGLEISAKEYRSEPDNNTVKIQVLRPAAAPVSQLKPLVLYCHGGGMAFGSAGEAWLDWKWAQHTISISRIRVAPVGGLEVLRA